MQTNRQGNVGLQIKSIKFMDISKLHNLDLEATQLTKLCMDLINVKRVSLKDILYSIKDGPDYAIGSRFRDVFNDGWILWFLFIQITKKEDNYNR